MKQSSLRTLTLATALALLPASATATSARVDELRFQVLLDDRAIGHHSFRILDQGSAQRIESLAEFDVRVLLVPLYRYRHENIEVWRDGCLEQINSQTDANGQSYQVAGHRRGAVFELGTQGQQQPQRREMGCIMSFAYWNRAFLAQPRLLNAQTGELVAVQVEPLGQQMLQLGGGEIAAEAFRVQAPAQDIDIRVWYALSDGRWLALESRVAGGRLLRYLPDDSRMAMATEPQAAAADTPVAH